MQPRFVALSALLVAVIFSCPLWSAGPKSPDLLIGKWQAADDKDKGVTVEFTRDGALKLNFAVGGLPFIIDATYKLVDDKTIEITTADTGKKGEKKTDKLSIKSSTDGECTLVDSKGKELILKRAVAPKQPKDFNPKDFNPGQIPPP